ncbi:hypothetical protein [Thalassovita taeanensis]|uniref:Uncharacterized protein n=1 Tax=Thalassovita taeanensis TaxID=657014 RepID=A0A1H9EM27_9RHOB|nr:hypothetical protein [Thalassovita taeanensis]SEQ26796.1 hypothetical protein SAMN04488092_105103 [Thalassovita taeanensis]
MPTKPVALEELHVIDGRARLRPAMSLEPDALKALADRIAAVPAVRRVLARPATGSLIVEFDGPAAPVFEEIGAQEIARIRPQPAPPPITQVARFGLMRADMNLKNATDGTLDLNSTVALLLFMGAAVQVARGQIAGPATTLVMAALAMLDRQNGK